MVNFMNYGEKLMFLKDRNELTNVNMAALIEVSDSLYSRYEKEKQTIPIKHLNTYANYFNTSIDYLFGLVKEQNKVKKSDIKMEKSGNRLKELRKNNNLTQEEFADIIGADDSTISKYEKGKQIIATAFLYDICKKYNISADYLLGKTDSPKYLK